MHDGRKKVGGGGRSSVDWDGGVGLGFSLILVLKLLYLDNYKTHFYASLVPMMRARKLRRAAVVSPRWTT